MGNNSTSTSGQELQRQSTVTQSVKMRDQLAVRSTEKELKESGKRLSQTTKMERIRMMFPSERNVSSI